jgi:hypothetical protein
MILPLKPYCMTSRSVKPFMAIVAGALLATGCCTTHHHAAAWDYKVLRSYDESNHSSLEKELNALGAEGWTVVSSSWVVDPPGPPHHVVILKRPKTRNKTQP